MPRKILAGLLFLLYLGVLFVTIVAGLEGFKFWFASDLDNPDLILFGLQYTIVYAALLVPLVLLRWWLKQVSWGTFFVLGFALAVGCFHFGTYHDILAYQNGGNSLSAYTFFFWFLATVFLLASVATFVKNALHIRDTFVAARSQARGRK